MLLFGKQIILKMFQNLRQSSKARAKIRQTLIYLKNKAAELSFSCNFLLPLLIHHFTYIFVLGILQFKDTIYFIRSLLQLHIHFERHKETNIERRIQW